MGQDIAGMEEYVLFLVLHRMVTLQVVSAHTDIQESSVRLHKVFNYSPVLVFGTRAFLIQKEEGIIIQQPIRKQLSKTVVENNQRNQHVLIFVFYTTQLKNKI